MGATGFVRALARGARGKGAVKALVMPDWFGTGAPANSWGKETLSLTAFAAPTTKTVTKKSKVTSCEVSFTPSQDLHGYDSPWPGGGGVNKFGPNESTDVGHFIRDDALIGNDDGWIVSDYISVLPSTEYTFNPNTTAGLVAYHGYYDSSKNNIGVIVSGPITFTTPSNCAYMRFSYRATSTDITLVLGSTSPATYSPYSNLCPISGWTGAEVSVDPKYGGDITWNQIFIGNNGGGNGLTITVDANNAVTVKGTANAVTYILLSNISKCISGHVYYINKGLVDDKILFYNDSAGVGVRYGAEAIGTATANKNWYIRFDSGASYGNDGVTFSPMICDLTTMFGAGNEPTTVDEFRALFPLDYYAYNAGTVTNVSAVSGLPYSKASVTFGTQSANQWDEEVQGGYYDSSGGYRNVTGQLCTKNITAVKPSTSYWLNCPCDVNNALEVVEYDATGTFIRRNTTSIYTPTQKGVVYTTSADCYGININFKTAYGDTYNHDIAINYPATVTTYNPYRNYILGGTADVVGGSGQEWYREYIFTGNEEWVASATPHRFSYNIKSLGVAEQPMETNAVQALRSSIYGQFIYKNADHVCYVYHTGAGTTMVINEPMATTTAEIAAIFAGTQLCYYSSIPTTYTFPPASEQLTLAKGTNNAWAEMTTGD